MILDTSKTYIHKKTGSVLKISSISIKILGNAQNICVEVCEILNFGHKFYCPVNELGEYHE